MTLDCYSRPGTPFGAKGPFYSADIGHRGQDYYASAGSPVVAYEDMVIEYVGNTTGLGTVVGARLARDGKHAGWAHLRNVRPFLNGWIAAGTQFAEVAGAGDNPGTLWDGAHIHTTLTPASSSSSAAANGNAPLEDPAPRITAARAGTAAAGRPIAVPQPVPNRKKKDMLFLKDASTTWWLIVDGGSLIVSNPGIVLLLNRAINLGQTDFERSEISIIKGMLDRARKSNDQIK